MKYPTWALLAAFLVCGSLAASAQSTAEPTAEQETSAQRELRMKWWREARFGLFIHWGLYAVPAGTWQEKPVAGIGEWIMLKGKIPVAEYAKYADRFNPVAFDAEAWVRLAQQAGMKYIVVTAKHHDGFAMFGSRFSSYNIVDATPFKRDPLAELAAACQRHGIKLGFYYSQAQDWHHRGGAVMGEEWDPAHQGDFDEYLRDIAYPQVKELLTNYGPIAILWWDTPKNMTPERAALLAPLIKLQPGIITNNRLGGGYLGDTETPEQNVPATGYPRDWEACMTMNDTWGFKSYDQNWKSAESLVRHLIDIVSKGGNYLLNVGPTAEGKIPAPSVERLQQVGAWLQTNGEAIYGTTASPFMRLSWGRATRKGEKLYLHVFDWPDNGVLEIPMTTGARSVYLLEAPDRPLRFMASAKGMTVQLPLVAPNIWASVVVLDGVGRIETLPPPPLSAAADGIFHLTCDAADLVGPALRLEGNTQLNLTSWRNSEASVQWHIQVKQPGEYEVSIAGRVSSRDAGGGYTVAVGDQRLAAQTASLAGDSYKEVAIGRLTLTAGSFLVIVRPTKITGEELMKLRAVTLTPVTASVAEAQ